MVRKTKLILTLSNILKLISFSSTVANYPFDDSQKDFLSNSDPRTVKNPTEENDIFSHLARVYSSSHRKMYLGKPCPTFLRESFSEGITNGADWYPVTGGMQDWSYLQGGTYELTLEIGCFKFPKAEELSGFWLDNREALLRYIEQVHVGVKGYVKSSIGTPIKHAAISVNNIQHVTYSGDLGDFYRLLLPGKYNITASASNYEPQTSEIVVPDSGNFILNFNLMRNDPQHWSSAYDYRILDNIYKTRYHSNMELAVTFSEYQQKNSWIAELEPNDYPQYYHSFKVTKDIGQSEETKIHVLVLSSLFETSPVGREIVMNLMRHVVLAFNLKEPPMKEIMENAVFHFVTVNVNFDQVYQQFSMNQSICDPQLSEELGDKLLNAESDAVKSSFYKLFEKDVMSLALTFTAGDDSAIPVISEQEPAFIQLAKQSQSRFGAQNQLCPSNAQRINENESVTKITNLLFKTFHIPLLSINLGCCKMPTEDKIAEIWREKIDVLKNFMNLVRTGVKGFVHDSHDNPLRNAQILIKSTKRIYKVSKNLAFFHVVLPEGNFILEIICENFTTKSIEVISGDKISNLGVIRMIPDPNAKVLKHYDISGYITDEDGKPIESAEIGIKDNWRKRVYSNRVGQFEMTEIDSNDVILTVNAQGFRKVEKYVSINEEGVAKNIIFKLLPADDVDMGFRNLILVFGICILIIVVVVCSVMLALNGCESTFPCCENFINRGNKHFLADNYKFSLLTKKSNKKSLFEEGDEYGDSEEEEELFSPNSLRRELQKSSVILYETNFFYSTQPL